MALFGPFAQFQGMYRPRRAAFAPSVAPGTAETDQAAPMVAAQAQAAPQTPQGLPFGPLANLLNRVQQGEQQFLAPVMNPLNQAKQKLFGPFAGFGATRSAGGYGPAR